MIQSSWKLKIYGKRPQSSYYYRFFH